MINKYLLTVSANKYLLETEKKNQCDSVEN